MKQQTGWNAAQVFNDLLNMGAGEAALGIAKQENAAGRALHLPSCEVGTLVALVRAGVNVKVGAP